MRVLLRRLALPVLLLTFAADAQSSPASPTGDPGQLHHQNRPNVILIMTDDQGYGDLGSSGNEMIQTPQLDALSRESVRMTNFHVDPTCSETRSALMTGRYSSRTGVWHTIMGRSILRRDETTMAEVFRANGYATGMFGKWHLGDNYPYRPQDRGFDEVLCHGGGGVGQTPDYWGNDYFDDTYFHNGKPEPQQGYCTDVFFNAATQFIETHQDEPFFCYLATNAAHGPYLVADHYAQPYLDQGVPPTMARFYGMIANIDENVGRLRDRLKELDLDQNTLLIFMTDNGTAAGWEPDRQAKEESWQGFNAGMRGRKGSQYEGGHRVPCFIYGPGMGIDAGESDQLCAHFDLLPTLVELCSLDVPFDLQFDGISLKPALLQLYQSQQNRRTLVVHSQRVDHPERGRKSSVMTQRWRLIDLEQLYDMTRDPGQMRDVAAEHPDVVQDLTKKYDAWWQSISSRFDEYVEIDLGAAECPTTLLTAHDWHPTHGGVPWNQGAISRDAVANGFWAVRVQQEGDYRITLTTRPPYVEHMISKMAGQARVKIGDQTQVVDFPAEANRVHLHMTLVPGSFRLQTWLESSDGVSRGAYFVTVEFLGNPKQEKQQSFEFKANDRIVMLGGTFIERMQVHNYFESYLLSCLPELGLSFRNLGWSGDDVYGTARAVFGDRAAGYDRMIGDVRKAKPTVILVAYGGNESFNGPDGLEEFKHAYTRLLDDLTAITPRLILVTPHRFENLGAPLPDHQEQNEVRRQYGEAILEIGQERGDFVIDLFNPLDEDSTQPSIRNRLTDQGIHYNEYGYWRLAPILAQRLGVPGPRTIQLEVDARTREGTCQGGRLAEVDQQANRIRLSLEPDRVPFAGPPRHVPRGGRMYAPHDVLIIKGLSTGKYGLSIDGHPSILASDEQWDAGVKVALGEYTDATLRLRAAAARRNELFFHFYRPQNETYLFLFRKHEQGNNAIEVEQLEPLIREADQALRKVSRPTPIQLELIPIEE